jgi:hypothetical protein
LEHAADAVRLAIICGAAIWFVEGESAAALKAVLVFPVALLGRHVRAPRFCDLLFTSALAAEVYRTGLGAYGSFGAYDTPAHVVLPLLSAPLVYARLAGLRALAEPAEAAPLTTGVVVAACVLALGALWELVEWAADSWLGTHYSQGYQDTMRDLLADAVAASAGGALVALWLRMTHPAE